MLGAVAGELQDTGYARYARQTPLRFRTLMASLGDIKQCLDIQPVENSSLYIQSTRDLPFHNEDPDVAWIGWYCAQPAVTGGESLLLDGDEIAACLSEETRTALGGMFCGHRNPVAAPILNGNGDWYYIPWSLPAQTSALGRTALDELSKAMGAVGAIRVPLERDDVLVVDNRRFLHSRTSFEDRRRRLVRIIVRGHAS